MFGGTPYSSCATKITITTISRTFFTFQTLKLYTLNNKLPLVLGWAEHSDTPEWLHTWSLC